LPYEQEQSMSFPPLWKLIACLVALCAPGPAAAAAGASHLEKRVTEYLEPLLQTNNFSGVILVAKGDRILLQKGYGFASIEHQVPNSPATVFQIASLSKPFTAAAIMLLQEQGKLDLRAPLHAVLPGYPNGDKLTIHHLLTHSSGIPNINDFDEYGEIQLKPHNPEQLVAYFKHKPLEFEPGSRYSYSNSNYNLLALIIEKASGTDYGSFLKTSIFDPLRTNAIGHRRSAAQIIPHMASGYAPAGSVGLERAAYLDWSVKTGNGSLHADAASVLHFIRAVHHGRLISARSTAASFTPHMPNTGYGWFLSQANGREIHHINGRSPGWAAQADHYVRDDVTVIVLANTYVSVTTEIARAVGGLLFQTPVKPMPDLKASPLDHRSLAAVTGAYQFGRDYYVPNALITVRGNNGHLEAMVGDYGPYPFIQISPTSFLIRSFWVPAEFTLGPNGRASELVIDGRKGTRVDGDR
jgi:CubicO group peptidase (beta-lactamase class C family)